MLYSCFVCHQMGLFVSKEIPALQNPVPHVPTYPLSLASPICGRSNQLKEGLPISKSGTKPQRDKAEDFLRSLFFYVVFIFSPLRNFFLNCCSALYTLIIVFLRVVKYSYFVLKGCEEIITQVQLLFWCFF